MRTEIKHTDCNRIFHPNVDDSIKPDFKVFWINRTKKIEGQSTFFTYEYGAEIIAAVFKVMYPGCEIIQIREINCKQVS